MKRRFLLFGATGSIGDSTLDVLRQRGDDFELVGFTWHINEEKAQLLDYAAKLVRGDAEVSGADPGNFLP